MTSLAVSDKCIVIAKGLQIDFYDYSNHVKVAITSKSQDPDVISDITISEDGNFMALITSSSKKLLIYNLPLKEEPKFKSFVLPRSASKIRFTTNNDQILVADKSGDVLIYNMKSEDTGSKLLGHLSLLLDVLQTKNQNYIISCDRDEKIRVSCYPNTYNIQTFCLGHKEFVNHIELLPHDNYYLTSTSGDGHIKVWDYVNGKLCYSIDTYCDINEAELRDSFTKAMDNEGIEVDTLPIVHYAVTQLNKVNSLLAVTVYSYKKLLLYNVSTENNKFSHRLIQKLDLERFPSSIKCHNLSLFVYDGTNDIISTFKIQHENDSVDIQTDKKIKMFEDETIYDLKESNHDYIKILYKRKFDNVQEYQERKKQRLERTEKAI